MVAAAFSLGIAFIAVLSTASSRSRFTFLFFLNAAFLVVPQRMVGGADVVVILSLVTILLSAFSSLRNHRSITSMSASSRTRRSSGLIQSSLFAFLLSAILSTIANSEGLVALLPWLNGVALGFLITSARPSLLPSFATVRRAVLVAGGVTVLYDISLLISGRAFNTGPFNAGRFTGSLGDYELLAEFYGALILICMTSLFFDNSRLWRLGAVLLVCPAAVILLATQSRGPIITLCILAPAFAGVSIVRFRDSAGKVVGVLISAVLALYFALDSISSSPLFARLSSLQFGGGLDSTLNRASVWGYFTQLPTFVDAGLVGNGYLYPYEEIGTYPHSIYLWLLWSGGMLGLICFCLVVLVVIVSLLRGIALPHSASLSAAVVVVYMLLDEIKIEAARNSASISFLWMTLSLALLAIREQKELKGDKQ
ncbi:O-antigen ligase family protein [Arthrobacter sp. 8AJ]|uniref:O-antigen ligase family protein n=1 Tax=Arthrobacter sp. 8AJ TaxID=2653130 RepID=UPI00135B9CFD|nr:hypothetical protein [Arthrobacter sp. 8AJ]